MPRLVVILANKNQIANEFWGIKYVDFTGSIPK